MANYDGLARNAWPGTWSTNGTHPIVLDVEQRGGLRLVSGSGTDTLVGVPSGMLQDGMLAYVASGYHADVSTGKYYKYSVLAGESRDSSTGFLPNNSGNWSEFTTSSSDIGGVSGVSDFASGLAVQNEADILVVSGIANGGLSNVVEDTTPQLGGNLDAQNNNITNVSKLDIQPANATDVGVTVQGAVSQTANLQEWKNSSDDTLSHVDTSGVYTNIIGTSGTDILRVQYGTPLHDHDGSSGADVTGVWLDYEDGSEYATPINSNALVIGTWYNTARTIESRIRISATAFNLRLGGSSKIDCQGSTTKFNTDVTPWSSSTTVDLGSESVPWTNVYASGATVSGVELTNHVPADTTNKLYNDDGTLKFNGSAVGGGNRTYNNITADFSMSDTSDVVFMDTSSGPINVYLPTASGQGGKEIMIKYKAGSNSGVLIGSGSQTIDGNSQLGVYNIYESISLVSDNSNWFIS